MANLPQNESYPTGGNVTPPKAQDFASRSGSLAVSQGHTPVAPITTTPTHPSDFASRSGSLAAMQGYSPNVAPTNNFSKDYANFNAGIGQLPGSTQLSRPAPGTRVSDLPPGYSGFVDQYNSKKSVPAKPGTKIRSIPGVEGQYLADSLNPSNQNDTLKSARGDTAEMKALMLGNRPSTLYQVDHIIPIWAGGADTMENKQVIPNGKHFDKTRAQAVTLALMTNKNPATGQPYLTKAEARVQALAWESRDLTDIPPLDKFGTLNIKDALKIEDRWKRQEETPGYGTLLGAPMKDILAGVPEAMKNFGKGWLPGPVREFAKGLVSGGTAGLVPYQQDGTDTSGLVAGVVGNVVGMITPVGILSKLLGLGGKAFMASRAGAQVLKPLNIARETKMFNAAQSTLSSRFGGTALANITKNVRYNFANTVKSTGALAIYGQVQTGFEGGDFGAHVNNFATNIAYGVGGASVPHSLGGAVLLAGYSLLPSLAEDSTDSRGAIVNALVLGTMHWGGAKSQNVEIAQKMKAIEPILIKEAVNGNYRITHEVLNKYLPKAFPVLKEGEDPTTYASQYNTAALNKLADNAIKQAEAERSYLPTDVVDKNVFNVKLAFKFLSNEKLPPGQKERAMAQDMKSLIEKANESSSFFVPSVVQKTADTYTEDMFKPDGTIKNSSAAHDGELSSTANPKGEIQLTGMTMDGALEPGVYEYMAAVNRKTASPQLFAVLDDARTAQMRGISNSYKPEDVAASRHKPMSNPQNSLPVYGVFNDAKGERKTALVGWVPREFMIGDNKKTPGQSIYSQNSREYITKEPGDNGFPVNDRNLNKDTLSNHLRDATAPHTDGPRVLFLNKGKLGIAKGSKKPYMFVTVNDENWHQSIEHAKVLGNTAGDYSLSDLHDQIVNAPAGTDLTRKIDSFKQKVNTPSAEIISSAPEGNDPMPRETTISFIKQTEQALMADTPEKMSNIFLKNLGVKLTPEETTALFSRKDSVSNQEIFSLIKKANSENRVDSGTYFAYASYVEPYLKSPAFTGWPLSKTFLKLRVVGGLKAPEQTTPAATTVQEGLTLKETPKQTDPLADKVVALAAKSALEKDVKPAPSSAVTAPGGTNKTGFTVQGLDQTTHQPDGQQYKVKFSTARDGKRSVEKYTVSGGDEAFVESLPLEDAQKRFQTADPKTLADRIANPFKGYDETIGTYKMTSGNEPVDFTTVPSSTTYVPPGEAAKATTPSTKPQEPPQAPVTPKKVETPTAPAKPKESVSTPSPREALKRPNGQPIWNKGIKITLGKGAAPQDKVSQAVTDLVSRGMLMIDNKVPSMNRGRDTTSTFAKKMGEIIKQITPVGEFSRTEETAIRKQAQEQLIPHIVNRTTDAINPKQEIAFKLGMLPEDPATVKRMEDITVANIMNAAGDSEGAKYLLSRLPVKKLIKDAQALGMAGENGDGGILSVLGRSSLPKPKDMNMSDPLIGQSKVLSSIKNSYFKNLKDSKIKEGKNILSGFNKGNTADPRTYPHSFSVAIKEGLTSLYGKNYNKNPKVAELIGKVMGNAAGRRNFEKLYSEDTKGFGGDTTHNPEYIAAKAEGSKTKAEQVKETLKKMRESESSIGEYTANMGTGERSAQSDFNELTGARLKTQSQIEGIGGLREGADLNMMPAATALSMGKNIDEVKGGFEDARGILQELQKLTNADIQARKESGKTVDPSKNILDRWVSFVPRNNAKTGKDIVKNTDKEISRRISEYNKKFKQRTTWSPETAYPSEKSN